MFFRSPSATADLSQFLFHRQALTGKGAFRAFQAGAFQQPTIGTHGVAGLQNHHVTGHHVPARYLEHRAVPHHLGRRSGHLLETVQRSSGFHRLHGTQDGVHGDDRQDDHRALHISHGGGDQRRQDQDDDDKVRKLLQEDPQHAFFLTAVEFIGAIGLQPRLCLLGGKAVLSALQVPEQLHPVLLPYLFLFAHCIHIPFRQYAKAARLLRQCSLH